MVTVLDPTVAPLPVDAVIADRPTSLAGAKLGLLANGKRNSEEMLTAVHGRARRQVRVRDRGRAEQAQRLPTLP